MSDLYFAAEGFAWIKGVEFFNQIMPEERFRKLYYSILETKGFKWAEIHFINWVVCLAGREEREVNAHA